jgi:acetylornithine/LysW-gamma-L-lysine aminotransferase
MTTTIDPQVLMGLEDAHESGVYGKRPLMLVEGRGATLVDVEGNEYLDCVAGHGAGNLGHCHPKVVEAIQQQAARLLLCPAGYYNDMRARLVAKLTSVAPGNMQRVFLCNSGAEAVEGALKFARVTTGRTGVVAAMRCFHGRTMGALSATWNKTYRAPFEPLVPGFSHVPYDNLAKLDAAVTEETGAVLLETVQGEGGIRPGSKEFLEGAQKICRERGAMLILDEIQSGIARTGKWFACQHYDLEPDFMPVAKSLAGGFPMGAVLIGERVPELPKKVHGSTFGGNPLACAAALAALTAIEEEGLLQKAAELGAWFQGELRAIESSKVREVRGLGLMVGLELKEANVATLQALLERKILGLATGKNVIRFLPPLTVSKEELERVVAALREIL